ncbi:hypothetical protein QBC43DRAFT_325312 [Cladorrhinum sp. PSN259]|nr:hypothetical protein QBC43DRAFT_325312 [Cladorrhinum sp. PSN259]
MKDSTFHRALRHRLTAVFVSLTLGLIIVFPTVAGAMTGYTPKTGAFIRVSTDSVPMEDPIDDFIGFRQFGLVAYIIHDGSRIGLNDNLIVPFADIIGSPFEPMIGNFDPAKDKYFPRVSYSCGPRPLSCDLGGSCSTFSKSCDLQANVSDYVQQYGFYGLNNTESIWANSETKLKAPVLNITAFYLEPDLSDYSPSLWGHDWAHPETNEHPFQDPTNAHYTFNNKLYDQAYLKANGRCQPNSEFYQWGFSYIQLFIVAVAIFIWSVGMGILWLQAEINLPLVSSRFAGRGDTGTGIPKGCWSRLLHLASEMNQDLSLLPQVNAGNQHLEKTMMTDDELKEVINKQLKGGKVSFSFFRASSSFESGGLSPCPVNSHPVVGLWKFCLQNKKMALWWSLAFGFHMVVMFLTFLEQQGVEFMSDLVRWGYRSIFPESWSLVLASWVACLGLSCLLFVQKIRWMWWYIPLAWVAIVVGFLHAVGILLK